MLELVKLGWTIAAAAHFPRERLDEINFRHALSESGFIKNAAKKPLVDGLQFAQGEGFRQRCTGKVVYSTLLRSRVTAAFKIAV